MQPVLCRSIALQTTQDRHDGQGQFNSDDDLRG
jgi:hypothetical protein